MNRRSNRGAWKLQMAGMLWMFGRLLLLNNGGVLEELLDSARKQSRPRRWPWQAKTIRDRLDARGEEIADYAKLQGDALLKIVQQQSRPRRWPWQEKTIRDQLDERSEEFAERAAAQSAALAALAAARRDELLDVVRKQSQPRRWPWQQKTARDRLDERSAQLASVAAERSAALAALAAARRDALLKEARRQTQPSRWPWQEKTAYDHVQTQSERAKELASAKYDAVAAQTGEFADAAAQRRDELLKEARRQAQPSRWPWQEKTAYDKATEQYETAAERAAELADRSGKALQTSAEAASEYARQAKDAVPGMVGAAGAAAIAASASLKDTARSAADSVGSATSAASETLKDTAKSVGSTFSASSNGATSTIKDAAKSVSASISSTAEDAADAVQSAVHKPVHAVSSGVKATKRTARWSRRVLRTALWAGLAGVVIGMLAAPESGKEFRKHLQAVIDQASRTIQGDSGLATQV